MLMGTGIERVTCSSVILFQCYFVPVPSCSGVILFQCHFVPVSNLYAYENEN